jgi:hypothetical protein
MRIDESIIVDLIGVAFVAVGAFGLVFLDYRFNKPDEVKVFGTTSLLGLFFWGFILSEVGYQRGFSLFNFPTLTLAFCTGFGAAKLTKVYGTIGHAIPRFLLGFLSCFVVHSFLEEQRLRSDIYIIAGLLFTLISFLTPSFMLRFIVVFIFSGLITNGLMMLNIFTLKSHKSSLYMYTYICAILGFIRLYYYYYKEDLYESNSISDAASNTERQPIISHENPGYSVL